MFPCEQLCTNTESSFECRCQEGYRLQDDGRKCTGKFKARYCMADYAITHLQILMNA